MSDPSFAQPSPQPDLSYLTRDYLPDSQWIIEGAFRFDNSLLELRRNMALGGGFRSLPSVAGAPPCRWNLGWGLQYPQCPQNKLVSKLASYRQEHVGVRLVFDNPHVSGDLLQDAYGNMLVEELQRHHQDGLNAVYVASDALADALQKSFPQLPVICHYNRLVAESKRRTPALYESLASRYHRVMLHPADAVRPVFYKSLSEPERYEVVINDSCLRNCPVRRDHMRLLAELRNNPYNTDISIQLQLLLDRMGCMRATGPDTLAKTRGFLTRKEARELHDAGFRHFFVQGAQYRNEMTLFWDFLHCALDWQPSLVNKTSYIACSALAGLKKHIPTLPSGLRSFDFQ